MIKAACHVDKKTLATHSITVDVEDRHETAKTLAANKLRGAGIKATIIGSKEL